jgi:hypothetical protein
MDENKAALVKKIGEGNKSLSVIVAEEKLAKFKKFSQGINLSMGYLLNQAIDRYLANNSIEIFNTSTGIPTTIGNNVPQGSTTVDMEELVKTSISKYLSNNPIGIGESTPDLLSRSDVEDMIKSSIGNRASEESSKTAIGIHEVRKLVNESIEIALEPIELEVAALKKL